MKGSKGGTIPKAPYQYGVGATKISFTIQARTVESLREAPKSPNTIRSTFFNTVNLLPRKLRFDHGALNLVFAPSPI